MRYRLFCKSCWVTLLLILAVMLQNLPALAASIDPYIARYLHVTEPISLELNEQGETRPFSPQELAQGKELFENHCMNCHVGGATLPDPLVSLSLTKLEGANPPRNNINNLVAYLRQPMVYDGSEETYWCRQVPESWLSKEQVESLSAFVLTAAQKAPGWGAENF